MNDPIHIMLDLETWGKVPGSDLRSIGACVFAPQGRHGGSLVHDGSLGTIKPFYVATDNPVRADARPQYSDPNDPNADRKFPLWRDPETVQWWLEQSAEAQAAFADPVDLREALMRFGQWLFDTTVGHAFEYALDFKERGLQGVNIWAHGPSFDPPILAAAYAACGLPVPWHYRAPRDTRTAFDMAGITDHSAYLDGFATGTFHHALDDAICQARAVCDAYNLLTTRRQSSKPF